jgi:hypothetical protein
MKSLLRFCCLGLTAAVLLLAPAARAERPTAPKLLPEKTLAYFRVTDTPLLVERVRETALGRMVQDEQVRPLVSQLYASVQNAWKNIEDRVGLPLDELLRIPQGEICVGFVAPPERPPGLVVLLDVKAQGPAFQKLLAKGEDLLRENGGMKGSEKIAGVEVDSYTGPDGNTVFLVDHEGTIVLASSKDVMEHTLKAWTGNVERTLADNSSFNSIMSRCAGAVDDPPQITYFVDPIEIVRTVARGSVAATGLALIPVLGLDGVKGVGGSLTFASGEFDDVQHLHVLLDNPRAGVVQLLAMKPGDITPEPWVPGDVITYNTLNWDFKLTFDKAAGLYNSLTNEGEFQAEVQRRISERMGIDFEKDVLPQLDGRVTFYQWVEKPVRFNSITTFVGLKLKDPQMFDETLQKVLERFADNLEKKSYAGTFYWTIKLPDRARDRLRGAPDDPNQPDRPALREPDPCVALLDDYLVITDSSAALQAAIAARNDPTRQLANELDYKLIASKIKRQVGGEAPGFVQFARAEQGMRFWYDLASAEDTKRQLARGAENNPFFRDVDQALKDNPLPPFSVLAKYLAPGGGMMVNDETGFHYMSFTLRRME